MTVAHLCSLPSHPASSPILVLSSLLLHCVPHVCHPPDPPSPIARFAGSVSSSASSPPPPTAATPASSAPVLPALAPTAASAAAFVRPSVEPSPLIAASLCGPQLDALPPGTTPDVRQRIFDLGAIPPGELPARMEDLTTDPRVRSVQNAGGACRRAAHIKGGPLQEPSGSLFETGNTRSRKEVEPIQELIAAR